MTEHWCPLWILRLRVPTAPERARHLYRALDGVNVTKFDCPIAPIGSLQGLFGSGSTNPGGGGWGWASEGEHPFLLVGEPQTPPEDITGHHGELGRAYGAQIPQNMRAG